MDKNKRTKNGNKVKGKLTLFLVLCIIMIPLIAGYIVLKDKKPIPLEPETTVEQTTEETTQPATEESTQPIVEQTTVETTAPVQGEPIIYSPTDEANWQLAIINMTYKLPEKYVPQLSPAVSGSSVQLDSRVAPAYQKMYDAAKADGCILTPYSGYRSYASQESTYNRKINYYINQGMSEQEATIKTNSRIMPPGCSEHNMGISMDIVSASSDFINTKEYKWLLSNAQNYGFIMRYPEDKVSITGVMFEPWHWRYVGEKAAKEINQKNICLEEYLYIS